jgi:hypothetical protein
VSFSSTEKQPGSDAQMQDEVDARLRGRWLLIARATWGALVALTLFVFFASLPEYLAQLENLCTPASCVYQQLTPGQAETLKGVGLSPTDYAVYIVALTVASMGLCLVISALLIWRRSDDRMAFFVALLLATFGPIIVNNTVPDTPSFWQVPKEGMGFLEAALLVMVFLLFPTGRFVPRWTRWTLVVYLVVQVPFTFFPNAPLLPNNPTSQFGWFLALAELATVVLVQFYRYRWVSGPLQRQQTKWVIFGLAVPIAVNVIGTMLTLLFPELTKPDSLYPLALDQTGFLIILFIPFSFGIAILRYRLWDIDAIINKALVYGLLTAFLAAVYVGLIIGLESLARAIIGNASDEPVVLVVSTLAIAALVQPVRKRIQTIIDRRFYRRKYDAVKTLEKFGAALRNEVDLNELHDQLLAAVEETMQPAHVSLWLRSPQPQEPYETKL